jgi:hypothetical protein
LAGRLDATSDAVAVERSDSFQGSENHDGERAWPYGGTPALPTSQLPEGLVAVVVDRRDAAEVVGRGGGVAVGLLYGEEVGLCGREIEFGAAPAFR